MTLNDIDMDRIWYQHMCAACENGDIFTVAAFVSKGFNVNYIGGSEDTWESPLSVAAQHGQTHIVEYLLDNGACVNAKIEIYDVGGAWTPLQVAVCYGSVDVVKLLLRRGATPLYNTLTLAIQWNHDDVVRALLDWGTTYDDVLLVAVQNLRPQIVKTLLEMRASISPKVLDLIKKHDFGEITQMILEHQMGQLKV